MITTSKLAAWSVLALATACTTPTESTCGAGTEADACAGSEASSGSSSSGGFTTFMTTASADDTTMSSATVGSASGASSTAPADGTAESSGGPSEASSTDATLGSSEGSAGTTGEPVTCPNGVVDEGEQCDGDALAGNDCVTLGFAGGVLGCAADCTLDPSACAGLASCGNGMLDEGEQCDAGDLGGASCEDAGDQYGGGTLGCNENCSFDTSGCCVGFGSSCAVHECCGDLLFCGFLTGLCL